ncbi:VOC family protein [Cellulomonas palmilytica]|uniref:VOC family protein n=1 Tax=Cellulomonas palmilytica TaxID=2608402 RepID=UPI001F3C7EB6|nr:VOC family protein [Cellulomonas palmilytica]UJP39792.1 VOC family protein [Cellulomonas palmilytica]
MNRPVVRLTSVTLGTDEPALLAAFYARLLGGEVAATEAPSPEGPGWAQVRVPDGPTLNFEGEVQFRRPAWPAVPGGQNATEHLDLWVDDLVAATRWAIECGATLAGVQPQADVRVLLDPSGHPFCLFL